WIFGVIGTNEALVVKKDSGIDSVKDLAGHAVGTPFVATTQFALLSLLKIKGLSGKVKVMDIQNPAMLAAWARGDIIAAYTWQPTLGKLYSLGGKTLVSSKTMAQKYGVVTANLALLRRAFAKKCPKIVTTWIAQQN